MRNRSGGKMHEGKIQHHGRFGFLLSETPGKEDIMLRGPSLRLAMEGDRVQVRMTTGIENRPMGEIVRVLERARKTVTGVLVQHAGRWAVLPEGADERDAVRVVRFGPGIAPRPGLVVVLTITQWPTLKETAGGEVLEALGMRGAPGVQLRSVLRSRDLPDAFPEAVLAESRSFPDRVSPEMWAGRLDLRALPIFTIDGADAKDFDDAVSLEPLEGGLLRLGVHIADVSYYVKPGTLLDSEAAGRATSVYMADRVVPMLPPNLSDHLCSLMPGVERLTLSCFMDVDVHGNVRESSLKESVIASRRRFTYEEVESVLKGEDVANVDAEVKDSLLRMGTLFRTLNARRMKRGALDLMTPEYKVTVDAQGRPLAVVKRERLDSHRLIEEFMLLANETVASTLLARRLPFLSRIHPDPDPRKLSILAAELQKLGVRAPGVTASPASAMQATLKEAEGKPLEETINMLVTRSLKQASYSSEPGAHFGLASQAYCHFTSPIRRYPDLVTHRAVRALLAGLPGTELAQGLEKLGVHCSERERLAADAERRSVDILRAELLKKRVGQVFDGVVSGSAAFGIFVTLKDLGASGLVRRTNAPLGSKVQIKLDRVNEDKGELDFSLVGAERPRQEPPRGDRPRWDKAKRDARDERKWGQNKPREDRPRFDPSKPRSEKPRFDPNKPRWEKRKWGADKPRQQGAGKSNWERPKFDPNKPRPKWDKPKWDPNKPRPKWDRPKFDPNKPKPKWDPNRPRFKSDRPKFHDKFRRPKPGGGKPFRGGRPS